MSTLKIPVGPSDHIQGDESAAVTLVEYGDYECPHCARAYPIVKKLQKHFGKQLRFVYRNFPLTEMHPNAEFAAETSEFAGAHDKFWEAHDLLFENQNRLGGELYAEIAHKLNLNAAELASALEKREFAAKFTPIFPAAFAAASMARPPSSSTTSEMTPHSTTKIS